jgi:hypothetical protein
MPQTTEITQNTHEPDAEHELATDAIVCGAAGCRETDRLSVVSPENRPNRVLCDDHAASYTQDGR